jgi:hypothetical protein
MVWGPTMADLGSNVLSTERKSPSAGLDNAPMALGLLKGDNVGERMGRVGPDPQ